MKSVLILIIFVSNSAFANMPVCLETAKDWIYKNTPAGSQESAEKAIAFCGQGGTVACLDPAKDWIYKNTPAGSQESSLQALEFCKGGQVSCLDPMKDWIYKNTPAGSQEAAKRALESCSTEVRCEPVKKNPAKFRKR